MAEATGHAGKGSADSVQAEGGAEPGAKGPGELAADCASVKRRRGNVVPPGGLGLPVLFRRGRQPTVLVGTAAAAHHHRHLGSAKKT